MSSTTKTPTSIRTAAAAAEPVDAKPSAAGRPIIKSHRQLAEAIRGRSVLLCNSLGKDSAVCLSWLNEYAKPAKIVSLFFERFTVHPDEKKYHDYQKQRYPHVTFLTLPDPNEITMIMQGILQTPDMLMQLEDEWFEYEEFLRAPMIEEVMREHQLDFVCDGQAGYEGMGRAQRFHNKGLLIGKTIYPLGLMKKTDIVNLIRTLKIHLNPTYKYYGSTFDEISYYRMRSAMLASPEFAKLIETFFPLIKLDRYRYEVVNEEIRKEKAREAQSTPG